VSLMYLNGEGVERNLERAKTYLDKALKEGIPGADYLKAEVEKRINFPRQEFQRVDFCSHLAISTFFMNKCQHVAAKKSKRPSP